MKMFFLSLLAAGSCFAGQRGVSIFYQPLAVEDGMKVLQVPCLLWNALSGVPCPGFITMPSLAPTDVPEGRPDLNYASNAKLKLSYSEKDNGPDSPIFTLDCSKAEKQEGYDDLGSVANIVRATLECLRLTYPKEVAKAEFVFVIPEGMDDVRAVTAEFIKHDKTQPFYKLPE